MFVCFYMSKRVKEPPFVKNNLNFRVLSRLIAKFAA